MQEDSVLEESVTEKGSEMVQVGAALRQSSQTVLTAHLLLHQKSPLLPYWNLLSVGFDRIGSPEHKTRARELHFNSVLGILMRKVSTPGLIQVSMK